ncbi:Uncharacterized protein BP5553_08080 [Venustampulla echinocandica]|uniref:Monopolin complex subunit Csm1/Pcs1 C-terminal domain-containing protein n=1 Tax=Venustampulla echinocandica TaxID=2656787 RepID=A0A370TFN7_9HELO|nr:Uncharacterized protein BP5553_08080 [Venustampulla echinocandica]RDL33712.1 Uncharacterized protein BP5553_08080 [Venustampulla echinocandica]
MAKPKGPRATLSGLIASDSEDSHFAEPKAVPILDSTAENKAPAKKPRGRPRTAAAKVTKTKAAPRAGGRLNTKESESAPPVENKSRRQALADKTNQQHDSDMEEVDDLGACEDVVMNDREPDDDIIAAKQTESKATKDKPRAKREKATKGVDSGTEAAPTAPRPRSRGGRKKVATTQEIPDEPSLENITYEAEVPTIDADADADEEVEDVVSKTAHNSMRSRADSQARQPSLKRRRAGSTSDTERGDPSLRRKLGDMTKKYDSLYIKYQDLREIGIKEADRNFERLRKDTDEERKRSNTMVASLKADVAAQAALAKESKALKKTLESKATEVATLQAHIAQLNSSLSEVRAENKTLVAENKTLSAENKTLIAERKTLSAENKTLSNKLAATRSAASAMESLNIPASAVKANGGVRLMGTAEAAQTAQAAQLKEDLYCDLTGLIMRGVKREAEEDIFDCIQTGRNGTLHFKLAVANENVRDSYDDAQCSYVPQLDPRRDNDLMEQLPDYLVDEISFPRPQAAKFYARVVKALTT